MKKLLLVLLFLSTGCVTMLRGTVHDYCVSHAEHYSNYDECYAEETARRENVREAMSHMGDGLKASSQCSTWNGQTTCR